MHAFDILTNPGVAAALLFVVLLVLLMPRVTSTVTFPTPMELREVEQVLLPQIVKDDPIFNLFPMVESNKSRLRWVQKDNYTGLQQVRGLNGQPRRVTMVGAREYDYKPGIYGEFVQIDEEELTERRQLASWDTPVTINDLVGDAQLFLLNRRLDRIRWIIWTLVTTGTFTTTNARGVIMHTDTFNLLTVSAGTPWSTAASSTPTADIRTAQQLSVGQSVNFGAGSELWMNQVQANRLLSNANSNDYFGRRINGGATINELGDINRINSANNLPDIVVYDRFYIDENGTPQKFIPNGKAILFGKRLNNAPIGEYRLTRNAVNPNMEPGAYTRVVDTRDREVPGVINVHDGHNGGPVIFFPGSIVIISC